MSSPVWPPATPIPPGTPPPQPPPAPPRIAVAPAPGSRLESLLLQRDAALAAVEEAKARAEAIVDGIKNEVSALLPRNPETGQITAKAADIAAGPWGPALTMTWKPWWHFDVPAFKKANPRLYASYADLRGHWELRKDTRGGSGT